MERIVVTGATSMIGTALIQSCLRHGVKKIYAVVRPDSKKMERLPKDTRVEAVCCDVKDFARLPGLIRERCDVFYHLAWGLTGAKRNQDLHEQARNIEYTLDSVEAARALGCAKFVGAGSQAEYGRPAAGQIGPDTPVHPVQPYGIAKYAAGRLAMEAARSAGLSCLWVRVFSVYGIYDKPTSMVSASLQSMLRGERARFTPAEQLWDYLFSADAGEAFYLVGERAEGRKVYCLGSGTAHPLRTYIEQMRDAVDPALPLGIGEIPYPEGTLMRLCADTEALRRDTGFAPRTPFAAGIRQTVDWMRTVL